MNLDELKIKAKELGYKIANDHFGDIIITFYKNGSVDVEGSTLSLDRDYNQMYAIMKALQ